MVDLTAFLSLTSPAASARNVNAAMQPSGSLEIARPTPALTSSVLHRWESAEVLHFEQEAEIIDPSHFGYPDPLSPPPERRKSSNNPFFGARSSMHSSHSRTPSLKSTSAVKPPPPAMQDKGKQRAITPPSPTTPSSASHNPFSDDIPRFQPSHFAMDSTSSSASAQNERAIQSLIAALGPGRDMTPQDVQDRLRVASLQPSFVSGASAYTDDDVQTVSNFPLPPSTL